MSRTLDLSTSIPAGTEPRQSGPPPPGGTWKVGNLRPGVVKLLTVFAFAIPIVAYLALVRHYQVNTILADQWNDVPVIRESYIHFPDWSSLWSVHNNNRVFFPNLIAVGLAHTAHFNIDIEEALSALMILGATALIIWSHKRRSPETPLLFYCPVAFMTLTLAQWQDALWGFQMAWYLVLFSLAVTIALIDRPKLSWPVFSAAVLAAVVGSYSSLQGLLIWPVALVLLYHRRRSAWSFITWIIAGVLTTTLYFHHFNGAGDTGLSHVLDQPLLAVKFYMFALGDVVGLQMNLGAPGNGAVMAFGIALFVIAILVLLTWGIRRDHQGGTPVGIALIVYGLLFDALVTEGRVGFGLWGASQSRYVPNDVLVLVGIFLSVLGRSFVVTSSELGTPGRNRATAALRRVRQGLERIDRRVLLRVALVAMAIQLAFSIPYGIKGARSIHHDSVAAAAVTRNIDHESDSTVKWVLYFSKSAQWLRVQAHFLRTHHLSLFN